MSSNPAHNQQAHTHGCCSFPRILFSLTYSPPRHASIASCFTRSQEHRRIFVPPQQAPFSYLYDGERALVDDISPVSALWPSFLPWFHPVASVAPPNADATADP
eukprot:m.343030 g.343030  ORF g.343030 m.343030 type:complete len:104 (-) comp27865_c5_seq8:283-594(-)